jgi:TnsA-like endonuclease N terminal
MSVRKIKKSYRSCTGYFASYKNNKQISFESVLERDFFMLLEFDKDVVSYIDQPFRIFYELSNIKTRYTPDVLVTYVDNTQKVFEVKYQNEIDSDIQLQHKLSILKDVIWQQKSLLFDTFTDKGIDSTFIDNAKFLYKFAFLPKNHNLTSKIKEILSDNKMGISVQNILKTISTNKYEYLPLIPYIWFEVFINIDLVDMYKKLTMSTIITQEINYE